MYECMQTFSVSVCVCAHLSSEPLSRLSIVILTTIYHFCRVAYRAGHQVMCAMPLQRTERKREVPVSSGSVLLAWCTDSSDHLFCEADNRL